MLLHYVDRDGPLGHWIHHGRGSLYVKAPPYYAPLARRVALGRARRGSPARPDTGPFGACADDPGPDADWARRERELIEDGTAEDTRRWQDKGGPPAPRGSRSAPTDSRSDRPGSA